MLSWVLKADDVQKALSGTLIDSSAIEKRPDCVSSSILDECALEFLYRFSYILPQMHGKLSIK